MAQNADNAATRWEPHRLASGADPERKEGRLQPADVPGPDDGLDPVTRVARAQDGDLLAFEALVNGHSAAIFRLAYRMIGDRSSAEEMTQETFINAWRRLETLTKPEAFRPWLFHIATRRCLDYLRDNHRHVEYALDSQQAEAIPADTRDSPEAAAQTAAGMRDLGVLVGRLPIEQRACWLLRDVHELSYHDIAATLRVPTSTVRGRIARARAFLAQEMDDWR